jgi:hypothetical protein
MQSINLSGGSRAVGQTHVLLAELKAAANNHKYVCAVGLTTPVGKGCKAREHKIQKNNVVCQRIEGTLARAYVFNRNFNSSFQSEVPKRIEYLLSGGNVSANLD